MIKILPATHDRIPGKVIYVPLPSLRVLQNMCLETQSLVTERQREIKLLKQYHIVINFFHLK